jgi:hypothetical protein
MGHLLNNGRNYETVFVGVLTGLFNGLSAERRWHQITHVGHAVPYLAINASLSRRASRRSQSIHKIVSFPRDGSFRGTKPMDARWCCTPIAFKGTDTVIRFIWDTSNPTCALINCRLSPLWDGVDWRITTLTNERLVLTSGKQMLTYEPVP